MTNSQAEARVEDDVFSAEATWDPYGFFGRLRERAPVHFNEKYGVWLITRYDDVSGMARDPQTYSSAVWGNDTRDPWPPIPEADLPLYDRMRKVFIDWIPQNDPPHHREMRQVFNGKFGRRDVEVWRSFVAETTADLLAALEEKQAAGETVDLATDFAAPLPILVVLGLLEAELDREKVLEVGRELNYFSRGDFDRMGHIDNGIQMIFDMIEPLIEARRDNPGDDLISKMLKAERDGVLSSNEVKANSLFFFSAGFETTMNAILNGTLAFIDHPSQWALLQEDPDAVCARAAEEVLRYEPSLKSLHRIAAKDVELRGKLIRKGDRIRAIISSSNRDPEFVENPDEFNINRSPAPRHLGYGTGPHACLGAMLARVEVQEVFKAFAKNYSAVELAVGRNELGYMPSISFRALNELPVRLEK
ncbi:MAG: cytochrome P450 [Gammaproteobacteria bacterium]|nr:cytochrome P450 [Gammaproteobacteria bacterium]